jgi:hypothetical protein
VRAFDGLEWSDWTTVDVSNDEVAPVVFGLNALVHPGQTVAATRLMQVGDGNGDPITGYELWDPIAGDGNFTIGGTPQPARQVIDVTPAQFATLAWDTTGQSGQTMFAVRATDGIKFGDWTTVTVTAGNTPPFVRSIVTGAHLGNSIAAVNMIFTFDAESDPITGYELWDPVAGDGGFTVNGVAQNARQVISVPSLTGLAWDTTGQDGTTVFAVRATDGFDFSDWTVITVQATDNPPVVAPLNPAVTAGQQLAAASLFQASDPDNDPITQYELWDPLIGDGNFAIGGTPAPARQVIDVAAADLAGVTWDATTQTGSTVVAVRAFDGTLWSAWTTVTVRKLAQALAAAPANSPVAMSPLLGRGDTAATVLAAAAH